MQWVKNWEIYLFQIYNKDFGGDTNGSKNIHTKYFEVLFAWWNDNLFKINGEAELFWRKWKTIDQKEHRISPKHHITITDKKRYTTDKIMFHLPITLNFCRQENQFNKRINALIQSQPNSFTILGIDRGEKHLLYYSLIDQQGNILKTGSRNTVWIKQVDYHAKLDAREKARDQAQQDRDQQAQIKDLKAGYISQVIHEITTMVIKHNALIVLEDLNWWFKRGRQKVEKNVYQQFELALAKKLNYLVFKHTPDDQPWGTLRGYQLTPPVAQFQDLQYQTGAILYTPAGYTSTTCPCCGWRKNLYLSYSNEKQAKEALAKVMITQTDKWFILIYTAEWGKQWTLPIQGIRYQYDSKTKNTETIDLAERAVTIFGQWPFDYQTRLQQASASDCKNLIRTINLLMKIRNAQTGTDIDVISCPSCEFNSTQWFQGQDYNGDANGAYNIARKGVLIVKKIVAGEKSTIVKQVECDDAWEQ
jgi:CRISPR-associated protein Cpf1